MNADASPTLLDAAPLPSFSAIRAEAVEATIQAALAQAGAELQALVQSPANGWDDTALALERLADRLASAWSPVRHLHSVADTPALRSAYQHCLPEITAFYTRLGQDPDLFTRLTELSSALGASASPEQRAWLEQTLRDMRLTGAALAPEARERHGAITARLSELGSRFSENVLDAGQAWSLHIEDAERLAGLPADTIAAARRSASQRGLGGALLRLDFPVYHAVQCHARDRALRETLYRAWATRASDQAPSPPAFDNSALLDEILALRHEGAQLLGFASHAHRSLATKMADDPQQVLDFLRDLARRVRPAAAADLQRLGAHALARDGLAALQPWDLMYYIERLRESELHLDQEALRPYFPLPRVLAGLFEILRRLFGIIIEVQDDADTWHPDVRLYRIRDADGASRGAFYLDPYAREGKRAGAWMDECRTRTRLGSALQEPVAYLTCNFAPAIEGGPGLLTHDEVGTLFHETGHGLHHLLTDVELPRIGGINGVAWDAVELPSQILENWCWQPEALALCSAHYQSGAALDAASIGRLQRSRTFMNSLQFVRQLEFALFDMRLHLEYRPIGGPIGGPPGGPPGGPTAGDAAPADGLLARLLDEARDEVAVLRPPAYNRMAHAFSHIFAGGYSAGYYSYKWAEVLSSDAFARFEEQGLFDATVGGEFRDCILARGASEPAATLFKRFRGRPPSVDALLRHSGLAAPPAAP